eukprot:m.249120 g.249120  ORF g.249120 m.249120 type:complete len:248 (+) comp54496_c1_seq2:883-1626(+)
MSLARWAEKWRPWSYPGMLLALLLTAAGVLGRVNTTCNVACPPCACLNNTLIEDNYDAYAQIRLLCPFTALTVPPLCLPQAATDLDMSFNNVSDTFAHMFGNLTSLLLLDLSGNPISALADDTFQGLAALERLLMFDMQLTSLSGGAFAGLPSLVTLYISRSPVTAIEVNTFQALPNLSFLYLANMQLAVISEGMFSGLGALQTLFQDSCEVASFGSLSSSFFLISETLGGIRSVPSHPMHFPLCTA